MSINENALPAQYRDINIVTAEIRTIKETARRLLLSSYIELGRRLVEAKELLPHGQWGEWLEKDVDFSQRTANNLMKIYEEYGSEQESLFGEVNSQSLANLTYTQAVLLLKVPKDEREEFVQEHDVEHLSTRELDEAIKARQAAETKAAEAVANLEEAEILLADTEKKVAAAEQKALTAEQTASAAEQRAAKAEDRWEKAVHALDEERQAKAKVKAELEKLKADPEIPAEAIEKISAEAIEKAEAEFKEKLEAANRAAEAADEQARQLRKELAVSNPEVAAFNVYFKQLQEDFSKLSASLTKIRAMNPETADKLTAGVKGIVEKLSASL